MPVVEGRHVWVVEGRHTEGGSGAVLQEDHIAQVGNIRFHRDGGHGDVGGGRGGDDLRCAFHNVQIRLGLWVGPA